MGRIDHVFVACQRHDAHYAKACVASVRRWHPEVPILLVKDAMYCRFSTREIERAWGVGVMETGAEKFGWGFSKLEPLIDPAFGRVMVLDADTLFVGPLLDHLAGFGEDFLVQHEDPTPEFVASHAYDLEGLRGIDPGFLFPGYTFNTGQFVARSGLLAREDFAGLVRWEEPRAAVYPDVFKMGEQGLLNYAIQRKVARGEATLRRLPMMEIPRSARARGVGLGELGGGSPHRFLIHWCGAKGENFRSTDRGDLLEHFERAFYARLAFGGICRMVHATGRALEKTARRWARALLGKGSG